MDPDDPRTRPTALDDRSSQAPALRGAEQRDRLRAGRKELEGMIDSALSSEERRVILVDGFNVLHAVLTKEERESGWWRREMREKLLRRAGDWSGGADEIWVAFDGAQPSWSVWAEPVAKILPTRPSKSTDSRGPTVHSLYVESADDWIVRRARRSPHPDRTIVVTADRQVSGRSRSAGCETWTPWTFLSRCPTSGEQGSGLEAPADLPD